MDPDFRWDHPLYIQGSTNEVCAALFLLNRYHGAGRDQLVEL
jgi:hypothetical protein